MQGSWYLFLPINSSESASVGLAVTSRGSFSINWSSVTMKIELSALNNSGKRTANASRACCSVLNGPMISQRGESASAPSTTGGSLAARTSAASSGVDNSESSVSEWGGQRQIQRVLLSRGLDRGAKGLQMLEHKKPKAIDH